MNSSTKTAIPDAIKRATLSQNHSTGKINVSGNTISLSTAKAGVVAVDVFGMNGKRVATLYRGNLAAGSYAFSLAEHAEGQLHRAREGRRNHSYAAGARKVRYSYGKGPAGFPRGFFVKEKITSC